MPLLGNTATEQTISSPLFNATKTNDRKREQTNKRFVSLAQYEQLADVLLLINL